MSEIVKDYNMVLYESQNFLHRFNQSFKACSLNILNSCLTEHDSVMKLSVKHHLCFDFQGGFQIVITKAALNLSCTLINNGIIYSVSSFDLRKNLFRSFIKTKFGEHIKLTINSEGQIAFICNTLFTSQLRCKFKKQLRYSKYLVEKIYNQMVKRIQGILPHILPVIFPQKYANLMNSRQTSFEKFRAVKIMSKFSGTEPMFLQNNSFQRIKEFVYDYKKEKQISYVNSLYQRDDDLCLNCSLQENCNALLLLWKNKHTNSTQHVENLGKKYGLNKLYQSFRSTIKSLNIPRSKLTEKKHNFSEIHIQDVNSIQWSSLYQSNFSILKKGHIKHFLLNKEKSETQVAHNPSNKFPKQRSISKQMVLKMDKNKRLSKIADQRLNIQYFANTSSEFIPNYYFSRELDRKLKKCIIMDFYPLKSLRQWENNFCHINSIFTRISVLYFISAGLNFLHENGIVHRDLKPDNIIINNRLSIKILDFSESYFPHKKLKNHGFTLPYSPPEYFKKSNLNEQSSYDIFSFGVMIFEIIFKQQIFANISRQNLKKVFEQSAFSGQQSFIETYQKSVKTKIFLCFQNIQNYGPMQIMTPLLNLTERCLDINPNNRPRLSWIIIAIKQTYLALLEFYSI